MNPPLYLTRLSLASGRGTDRLLADFVRVHQLVCAGLHANRADAGALHHTDPVKAQILVQSALRPDWTHPDVLAMARIANAEVKNVAIFHAGISEGHKLALRLLAVPERAIPGTGGRKRPVSNNEEATQWLEQRIRDAARVIEIDATAKPVRSAKPNHHDPYRVRAPRLRIAFTPVEYRGAIEIIDADRFRGLARAGLGPGKAYGFGLVIFARE